jgi:hypothetical protein
MKFTAFLVIKTLTTLVSFYCLYARAAVLYTKESSCLPVNYHDTIVL